MRTLLLFFLLSFCVFSCNNSVAEQDEEMSMALPDGKKLFIENCAVCHGGDGTLRKAGSKDLTKITLNFDQIKHVIEWGTDTGMPRFKEILSTPENIDAVTLHVLGLQQEVNNK